MSSEKQLSRLSRRIRTLLVLLFISVPVMHALVWSLAYLYQETSWKFILTRFHADHLTVVSSLLGMCAGMIPGAVVMMGIWQLINLFRLYEKGDVFESGNVACFRKLSRILFYWVFAGLVSDPLISLALTMNNPVGERMVNVGFQSADLTALVVGGVMIVITRVMEIGKQLQDDQDYTI